LTRTLAAVSESYRTLDPASLKAVWPGADTASLSRSFSQLKYQSLKFDQCAMRSSGSDTALATCEVSIALATRTGDQGLQRRHERWSLALERSNEGWRIAGVSVR